MQIRPLENAHVQEVCLRIYDQQGRITAEITEYIKLILKSYSLYHRPVSKQTTLFSFLLMTINQARLLRSNTCLYNKRNRLGRSKLQGLTN